MSDRLRVVVIGGGIAGVSAAWALAANHDVVVLEAEAELATHTTGRSAATLSQTSGLPTVGALARASRQFLESPPAGFVDHPLTSSLGLLWVGRHGEEQALDAIAAMAASGVAPNARRVDAAAVTAVVPVMRPEAVGAGGVWEPDAIKLDVAGLLAAYASGARARGATVRRRCRVRALSVGSGGWTVQCEAGDGGHDSIAADVVVNASGAWGDHVARLAGVTPLGLRPLRRTACVVPAPVDVASWPLVMDVTGRFYFEPEAGGLLLSPADEHPSEAVDAVAEMEDVAWALEMLAEATTLDIRHVRNSWAGLRTFTTDRVPVVGWDPVAPGFCWLVGQGGAGIKTAPALAAAVAAVVGAAPWPPLLDEVGVAADELSPGRLVDAAPRIS